MNTRCLFPPKVGLTLMFSILVYVNIQAQQSSDSLANDTVTESILNYFSFDLGYTNNNLTDNTLTDVNTSAILADFSFYHKSGIYVSLMPLTYPKTTLSSNDVNVSAGYQYFFNNGFDVNAYYLYHHYKGDSVLMGIDYNQSMDLSIGYTFKGLYAYCEGFSTWGNENNYFVNTGLGYYAEWYPGQNKNNFFSVFPLVSFTLGTDYWVYTDMTPLELLNTRVRLKHNNYAWDTFDSQNVDFMFPVNFTHNNFSVSLSYIYSIPTNKYSLLGWQNQSGLMFSLNYLLNLN